MIFAYDTELVIDSSKYTNITQCNLHKKRGVLSLPIIIIYYNQYIVLRDLTGKGPTQLAAFETSHITHVLEQAIRGYLCGSNDKKWSNHVFNYNNIASFDNILTYFYRIEFQGRGSVHIHLLVWLKDIKQIRLNLLRADIPWANDDFTLIIYRNQMQGLWPYEQTQPK